MAALHGDATIVIAEDHTTVFAMLEERRANLAAQRVRVANQLHAVLRDLIPGGGPLAITAKSASTLLRSVRPESPAERTRKELAQDLVRELRAADTSLADIEKRMTVALDDHGFADTSTERSLSNSRGVAPVYRTALNDAMNVNVDTGTTVSGARPVVIGAAWRAAVLLAHAMVRFEPTRCANSDSNRSTKPPTDDT